MERIKGTGRASIRLQELSTEVIVKRKRIINPIHIQLSQDTVLNELEPLKAYLRLSDKGITNDEVINISLKEKRERTINE